MSTVQILSGIGEKGPACMRLRAGGQTWLLDCGHGPDPRSPFRSEWLDDVDAVFISHDHIDHVGGARQVVEAGLPIYTTQQIAEVLPDTAKLKILPELGISEVEGIRVTTGRNGHALGGIWFHFGLGEGLFYSGDWSEESDWFAFDRPPEAATAILDCSYHLYDVPQTDCIAALDRLIEALDGQILLPVPPSGRAGQIALHLMGKFGAEAVYLDETCRSALQWNLERGDLPDKSESLRELLDVSTSQEARFLLCDTPNADDGAAWRFVSSWQAEQRLGKDAHVVFTGHMTRHARAIRSQPGGHFQRWNVHPPLRDQINMLKRLNAQRFAPAFCSRPEEYLIADDLGAEVFLHEIIEL